MKKIFLLLCSIFIGAVLVGCVPGVVLVTSIEVVSEQSQFDETFQISDLGLKINRSDGTSETIPLTESMILAEDLEKFSQEGTHTINVSFLGAATSFEITIQGEKGDDGREVELQVNTTHIQWRYVGDTTWIDLIALDLLKGEDGTSGPAIEFQVGTTHLQWRFTGEETWTDLIALDLLQGANGLDGRATEMQVSATHIQWRYVGDPTWTDLIALSALVGAAGPAGPAGQDGTNGSDGEDGEDGRELEIQVSATHIQWRYVGDATWTDLIPLTLITGEDGEDGLTPTIEINEDGYWVINGVVTIYKAVGEGGGTYIPPTLTVTFDVDGGELPVEFEAVQSVDKGDSLDLPIPTKEGYVFKGWFTGFTVNDMKFSSYLPITKNMTLYAVWEEDLTPLIAFFEIFKSYNYTAERILEGNITVDTETYTFNDHVLSLLEQRGDDILFFKESHESFAINGIVNPRDEWLEEMWEYYRAYPTTGFERGMVARWNGEDLHSAYSSWAQFQHVDLSVFDLELFVKREGLPIYDYPADRDILQVFGVPVEDGMIIHSIEFSLDLSQMAIFVSMTGLTKMDSDTYYPMEGSIEVYLTDVGTTVVDIPLNFIQMDAMNFTYDQIDLNVDFSGVTEASKTAFFDELEVMFNQFLLLDNLVDVAKTIEDIRHFAENYNFDWDELLAYKNEVKYFMEEHLNELSMTATDESITLMQELFDNMLVLVFDAVDDFNVSMLANGFHSAVEDLYEADPNKLILVGNKERMSEFLWIYIQLLGESFTSYPEFNTARMIVETYEDAIWQAETLEDVELAYENGVQALLDANFSFGTFSDARNQLLGFLDQIYEMGYDFFKEDPVDLDALYDAAYDQVTSATNPILMIYNFIQDYYAVNNFILVAVKASATNHLDTLYAIYLEMVEPEGIEDLDSLYAFALEAIQNETEVWRVYEHVRDFEDACYDLPFDELLEAIYYRKINLNEYFNMLKQTSSPEGVVAMQVVMDTYLELMDLVLDFLELDNVYYAAIDALDEAYIVDPELMALAQAKNQAKQYLNNIVWWVIDFVVDTNDYHEQVYNVLDDFQNQIEEAMSYSEVETLLMDAREALVNLPVPFEGIGEFVQSIYQQVDTYIAMWEDQYPLPHPEIDTIYQNLKDEIALLSNGFEIAILCFDSSLMNEITNATRTFVLSELEELYTFYQWLVLETEYGFLDDLYTSAVEAINEANEYWQMFDALHQFDWGAKNLEADPLRLAMAMASHDLQQLFNELSFDATEDSILAMQAVLDLYSPQIDAAVSIEEVNTVYDLAEAALWEAYVLDPEVANLMAAQEEAIGRLEQIVNWSFMFISDEPDDKELVIDTISYYGNLIWNAETVEDVWLAYDNAKYALTTLEITFVKIDDMVTFFSEQVEGYYQMWQTHYPLPHPEIDLLYDLLMGSITIDQTPFEIAISMLESALVESINEATRLFVLDELQLKYDLFSWLVVEEELPQLDILYAQYVNQVNNASDYWGMFDAIYEFEGEAIWLETIPLHYAIYTSIDSLHFEFRMLQADATDDSILAMQAVLDLYIPQIEVAETEEAVDLLYDAAFEALFNAYEQNPEKLALQYTKNEYYDLMYQMVESLTWYLDNPEDDHVVWDIYYIFIAMIEGAESVEAVELAFNNAILEWKSKSFVFNISIENLMLEGDEYLLDIVNDASYYLEDIAPELIDLMDAIALSASTSSDFIDIIVTYILGADALHQAILDEIVVLALIEAQNYYDFYAFSVTEDALIELDALFAELQVNLGMVTSFADPFWFVERFADDASWLDQDPLKSEMQYWIDQLIISVEYWSYEATADSIDAMWALVDEYTLLIKAATDISEISPIADAGFAAINDAFVLDEMLAALNDAKQTARNTLWGFIYQYVDYVFQYQEEYDILYEMVDNANDLIEFALSIEDIEAIVNNTMDQLTGFELNYLPDVYYDYFWMMLSEIDNAYAYAINPLYSEVPQHVVDMYDAVQYAMMNEVGHPMDIYFLFVNFVNDVEAAVLDILIIDYLDDLDISLAYYLPLLIDEDMPVLQAAYDLAYDIIQNAPDQYTITTAWYEFSLVLNEVTIDELKEAKFMAVQNINNVFNYYASVATETSITNMDAVRLTIIEDTLEQETVETVNNTADQGIFQMTLLFEIRQLDLFFSEYGDGTGMNNWIEIFNPNDFEIDLSDYSVELYANGSTTVSTTHAFAFETMIAARGVYILYSPSMNSELFPDNAYTSFVTDFDGNDALVLKRIDEVMDIIGVIGDTEFDETLTNTTLIRRPYILEGSDTFNEDQWNIFGQDDLTDINNHVYYSIV